MLGFTLIDSPDEIIQALNGNGYNVILSPNYLDKYGFRAPTKNNMNKDGLYLEYYAEKYPEKTYKIFIDNEYEIESHNIFNIRLIKYMFDKYGDRYLNLVKNYVLLQLNKTCINKSSTYFNRRLKDDMQFYQNLYKEVKANKAKLEKEKEEKENKEKQEKQEKEVNGKTQNTQPAEEAE